MDSDNYQFRGQRPDEEVAFVTKQHIWLLLPVIFVWLIAVIILVGLIWWLGASRVTSIAIVVLTIIGLVASFCYWFVWSNSCYIVTNQRVIKIDQDGLFSRVISEAEIDRIQEISTEIKGPIKTMLNFGAVKISTASDNSRLDLNNVTDPYGVQQEIVRIQKQSAKLPPKIRQV